jgi:hypothetical protein
MALRRLNFGDPIYDKGRPCRSFPKVQTILVRFDETLMPVSDLSPAFFVCGNND